MHIAIDAHSIGSALGGNETYVTNLIEALADIDARNEYTLYVTKQEAVERFDNRWPNVGVRRTLPHTPLVRIPVTLSAELRLRPVDILLVQYTSPPWPPCSVVAMIHDLSFEHLPETFKRRSWMQMRLTVRQTARSAAHIVTDSEFSRADILKTYRLPPDRVTTTYLAASSAFQPVDPNETVRVRQQYGISGDYVLAVGSIQPRKNIARLINAYASLLTEGVVSPVPDLVIVGKRAWLFEDTLRAARNTAVREHIIFTDYVPESDLPALYSGALCFVYPSYFEGFGIPLLEAMSCGTPTIASNLSCFPEVVGDASLMIDPFDEASISAAIFRLIQDEPLRNELRTRGFKRSRLFDWRKTALLTLDIFERVYQAKQVSAG